MSRPSPPDDHHEAQQSQESTTGTPPRRTVRFSQLPSRIPLLNNKSKNNTAAQRQSSNNSNNLRLNNDDENDDNENENEEGDDGGDWKRRQRRQKMILVTVWRWVWFLGAGTVSFLFLRSSIIQWILNVFRGRLFSKSTSDDNNKSFSSSRSSSSSLIDDLFESPFLDDNEELRLRPVSVNTYVYVMPTHQNEDGIFVKLLIENTSELATE